jgi:hypothetical protein
MTVLCGILKFVDWGVFVNEYLNVISNYMDGLILIWVSICFLQWYDLHLPICRSYHWSKHITTCIKNQ